MENILRNRNPPLVLLNSNDDTYLPQEIQKFYVTPNSRERRSNAYGEIDDINLNKKLTTGKPRDLSALMHSQMLRQN